MAAAAVARLPSTEPQVQDSPSTKSTMCCRTQHAAADSCLPTHEGLREAEVMFCADQMEWLEHLAARCGHATASEALQAVINFANAETPKAKKQIFLVVRCRRCLQHTTGGEKRPYQVELPGQQWQWLQLVGERCRHASVGKTLRIIVDFYMPLCKEREDFELVVGGSSAACVDAGA
mmetsp:Transcript_68844/g.128488  ORF Transcript_68844/g.128488 Transcript_68844/m.128488 type:complete len:177 (-) Transcript_68844:158-688(-)